MPLQDWLSANIIPVFKKGNRSTPANYRPISLTSVTCKAYNLSPYYVTFHITKPLKPFTAWI